MSDVKILWMYNELLDLYGDSGNVSIVSRKLQESGHSVDIDLLGLGDKVDFCKYNMVYMGPGKARHLAVASEDFKTRAENVKEAVSAGVVFFVTDNSRFLFGRDFTGWDSRNYDGIGLFEYTGVETGQVFISDVIASPVFDPDMLCYGFINRTAHIYKNTSLPLFKVISGAGENPDDNRAEGNCYKNFFGTWLMGPLLAKNPDFLRMLLERIVDKESLCYDDALERKAHELTLAEFDLPARREK